MRRGLFTVSAVCLVIAYYMARPGRPPTRRISPAPELRGSFFQAHSGPMFGFALTPDGRTLATAATGESIKLWALPKGRLQRRLDSAPDAGWTLAFSSDGKWLASGGNTVDGRVRLWEVKSGLGRWESHVGQSSAKVQALAFANGDTVLAGGSTNGSMRLWQVPSGQVKRNLLSGGAGITAIRRSPSGMLIAAGDHSGVTRMWQLSDGGIRPPGPQLTGGICDLLFVTEDRVAAASWRGEIRIWTRSRARSEINLRPPSLQTQSWSIAASQDGRWLAAVCTTGYEAGEVWDCRTGRRAAILQDHPSSVAFSPTGKYLAVTTDDRRVRIISTETWTARSETQRLPSSCELMFSRVGHRLVAKIDDGTVGIWDLSAL